MQRQLLLKVALAALLGAAAGLFLPSAVWGISLIGLYSLLGQLFLRALTLIVVPLVAASLIAGTMRLGADQALGRLGGKIAVTFVAAMATAVALGVAVIGLAEPGRGEASAQAIDAVIPVATAMSGDVWTNLENLLHRIIPANVLGAAAQGEILGVIAFSLFFGVCCAHVAQEVRGTLRSFWEGTFQALLRMTQMVMRFLPWGVFGLIAKACATLGGSDVAALGWFCGTVVVALVLYACVLWPAVLYAFGVSPIRHFRAMFPALVTAFSTSSSAATLPIALECLEKSAGVSNRICSLVLPLGVAVNLSASALYAGAVVVFVAQMSSIPLGIGTLVTIYLTTLFTSFGMAGIPSASLIVVVLVLQTLKIPNDHLGLIMAIERLADMVRTAINVFATSCCAVVIARWEGEHTAVRIHHVHHAHEQ